MGTYFSSYVSAYITNQLFGRPPRTYSGREVALKHFIIWYRDEYSFPHANRPCLYLPYSKSNIITSRTPPVLLYLHGRDVDLFTIFEFLLHMRDLLEVSIFAPEFTGYGPVSGPASVDGTNSSALHALRILVGPLEFNPDRIFIMGRSLGCGPACFLANEICNGFLPGRATIGGLILHSPFDSISHVVYDRLFCGCSNKIPYPRSKLVKRNRKTSSFTSLIGSEDSENGDYKTLSSWGWDNSKLLSDPTMSQLPLLIIHGKSDEFVNISHGQRVFANAASEKKYVYLPKQATHADFDLDDLSSTIKSFIRKHCVNDAWIKTRSS